MQSLDIISVNIWQILISLCNLALLFLILKKFLYAPVRKVIAQRRDALSEQFNEAERDRAAARADREMYAEKLRNADADADAIRAAARQSAEITTRQMTQEAQERAEGIVKRAEQAAAQEMRRAEQDIRDRVADVSTCMAEKLLGRELQTKDQRALVDDFLKELGDENDADR